MSKTKSNGKSQPTIHSIELELESKTSASISCVGADGRRYHIWVTTEEPLRCTNGWLYCNPPAGVESGQPGHFWTRQYGLGTRYKNMDAIAEEMLETAKREGLLAKARTAYAEKIAADTARLAEIQREAQIKEHGPELLAALEEIKAFDDELTQDERVATGSDYDKVVAIALHTLKNLEART